MKIESSSAQINVRDNDSGGGVNINPVISGYGAEMMLWGCAAYLCRRKDDSFLRVVVVPSKKWKADLADSGYEIIADLSTATPVTAVSASERGTTG